MMHFPPLFQISPLFSKNFKILWRICNTFDLSPKNFRFSSAEISDDLFFSHRPQILNFPPIFTVSVHFPLFRGNYYFPPYFDKFPSLLNKFTCFLHTLRVFRFPPTFIMMHLCITQCTYWTPLHACTPIYIYRDVHTFLHTCLNSYIKTSPPIIPSTTDNGKMIFIHSFLIFL